MSYDVEGTRNTAGEWADYRSIEGRIEEKGARGAGDGVVLKLGWPLVEGAVVTVLA